MEKCSIAFQSWPALRCTKPGDITQKPQSVQTNWDLYKDVRQDQEDRDGKLGLPWHPHLPLFQMWTMRYQAEKSTITTTYIYVQGVSIFLQTLEQHLEEKPLVTSSWKVQGKWLNQNNRRLNQWYRDNKVLNTTTKEHKKYGHCLQDMKRKSESN